MLWTFGIELAKYAGILYLFVLIGFSGFLYFKTRNWESVLSALAKGESRLSVFAKEGSRRQKALPRYQTYLLMTLRTARYAAATGLGILAILSFIQLAKMP